MKNKRKKRKNAVLKAVTMIAIIGAIVSGCCLDSKSKIPMIVLAVCLAWVSLFSIANMGD